MKLKSYRFLNHFCLFGVGACVLAFFFFLLYQGNWNMPLDSFLKAHQNKTVQSLFVLVTLLCQPEWLFFVYVLFMFYFLRYGQINFLILWSLGLWVGTIFVLGIKFFVVVSRPDWGLGWERGSSIISGHALFSIVFWGSLFYFFYQQERLQKLRWFVALTGVLFILMIGLSRLVLGVHYLGDVVWGYGLGAVIFWGEWRNWAWKKIRNLRLMPIKLFKDLKNIQFIEVLLWFFVGVVYFDLLRSVLYSLGD